MAFNICNLVITTVGQTCHLWEYAARACLRTMCVWSGISSKLGPEIEAGVNRGDPYLGTR